MTTHACTAACSYHIASYIANICLGVTVVTSGGDTVVCCATLICATFDLPARAAILNMVQFNGYCKCLQKGIAI